jgi:hypothetical protein
LPKHFFHEFPVLFTDFAPAQKKHIYCIFLDQR